LRLKDGALFSRIGLKWAARPQATSEGTPA